jgi:hypothetical protein
MKRSKLLLLATLLMLPFSISYGVSIPEYTSHHGSICQPALLQQSINLSTRWIETGVKNTNPLGSGKTFFVLCPIVTPHDNVTLTADSDLFVNPFYDGHDGTNQVFCFARRYRNGVLVKQVAFEEIKAAGFTGAGNFVMSGLTDVTDGSFSLAATGGDFHVMTCRLPPQSGIIGYTYDYD